MAREREQLKFECREGHVAAVEDPHGPDERVGAARASHVLDQLLLALAQRECKLRTQIGHVVGVRVLAGRAKSEVMHCES